MPFKTCDIPGLIIVEPAVFEDSRGYFFESYNQTLFEQNGIACRFVQDNQSHSYYGVIRGLHFQMSPFAQSKLIRVLAGQILDVAVDIRKGSPTFGQSYSIELSEENRNNYLFHTVLHMDFQCYQLQLLFYINVINSIISKAKAA